MMQALIMAGGKGTRLRDVTGKQIPKPMAPILGKPVIEYQIEQLSKSGFDEIVIVIGYLGEVISKYLGDGSRLNVKITYISENYPLGTAGSFFFLRGLFHGDFAMVYGDLLFDIDWRRFSAFHKKSKSALTLYAHPNSHPYDSDLLEVDKCNKVTGIIGKKSVRPKYFKNIVNAGVYMVNPSILLRINKPKKIDFEKEIIPGLIDEKMVSAYQATEYIKDVGTVDRFNSVSKDLSSGILSRRNLKNKQTCIFLDRDGTLNKFKGFLCSADDVELETSVAQAVKLINQSGMLCVVITNQPVIARGDCSLEEMDNINMCLEMLLGEEESYIDGFFLCPHHPDSGFEGEVRDLKVPCNCRKPSIGMLIEAANKMNIDLGKSWFVGDTTVDVKTGFNAGMNTILLLTGQAGMDGKYDLRPTNVASNLLDAINMILDME